MYHSVVLLPLSLNGLRYILNICDEYIVYIHDVNVNVVF